jgi:hypothetical protein
LASLCISGGGDELRQVVLEEVDTLVERRV